MRKFLAIAILVFFIPTIACQWFATGTNSVCTTVGGSVWFNRYFGALAGAGAIILAVWELL